VGSVAIAAHVTSGARVSVMLCTRRARWCWGETAFL
jgi:hypothetical protein